MDLRLPFPSQIVIPISLTQGDPCFLPGSLPHCILEAPEVLSWDSQDGSCLQTAPCTPVVMLHCSSWAFYSFDAGRKYGSCDFITDRRGSSRFFITLKWHITSLVLKTLDYYFQYRDLPYFNKFTGKTLMDYLMLKYLLIFLIRWLNWIIKNLSF